MEWAAYASIEPFGFHIDDARTAIVASTVANAAGAKTKPEDFMLGERGEAPADDVSARLAAALGAQMPPKQDTDSEPPNQSIDDQTDL